jgi:hypothetical protein
MRLVRIGKENEMWKKLKIENQWGAEHYEIEDTGEKLQIPSNGMLEVKWPDGTVCFEKIGYESYRSTVSDHGKSYVVHGELPVVSRQLFGATVTVPLSEFEIWIED